jgi:hypothetical protein
VTGATETNRHDTFKTDSVSLETVHCLYEEIFASGGHAGYVVLFPFYRGVDVLEDLLDRVSDFCTYAVAWYQRDLYTVMGGRTRTHSFELFSLTVYIPPYFVGSWEIEPSISNVDGVKSRTVLFE